MQKIQRSLIVGVLLLLGALTAGLPALRLIYFAFAPNSNSIEENKIIQVHKGENPNEIAKELVANGTLSDGRNFLWLGRLTRQWKRVKAGEYQVTPLMSPLEIFSVLTSGVSIAHPLTVREGENMYEIAEDLESKKLGSASHFLKLCQNQEFIDTLGLGLSARLPNLEGYIFPDTYFFDHTRTEADIIRQMVKQFTSYWGQKEEQRAKALLMTRHQIITLASIIEKETGASEERALISSVFHNRLKKGMKLQSDPTTIYGIWSRYKGKIHKSDLSTQNDYNTYTIQALPIGPIANPGKEAIQAALYPTESPYLYFVSHNDGTHQFSKTFEEHNRAVQKFQLDPKARAGKSWRDHLKGPASVPNNHPAP